MNNAATITPAIIHAHFEGSALAFQLCRGDVVEMADPIPEDRPDPLAALRLRQLALAATTVRLPLAALSPDERAFARGCGWELF